MSTGAAYKVYRRPDSGKFRHTLDILVPPTQLDDRGQVVGEWVPCFESVKGSIEPLVGRQIEQARALYNEANLRIEFRFLDGIKPKYRIRYRATGQLFHIGYVDNTQYERTVTSCLVSEVV